MNDTNEALIAMSKIVEGKNRIIDRQARQLSVAQSTLELIHHRSKSLTMTEIELHTLAALDKIDRLFEED